MLVDSWYDSYLGVVVLVRVKNGKLTKNQKIKFMATGAIYTIDRVGIFSPKPKKVESFDDFLKWSNVLLHDFNEIDRNLVDAKSIYTNDILCHALIPTLS